MPDRAEWNAYQKEYQRRRREECKEAVQTNIELKAEIERIKTQFERLTGHRAIPGRDDLGELSVRVAIVIQDLQRALERLEGAKSA